MCMYVCATALTMVVTMLPGATRCYQDVRELSREQLDAPPPRVRGVATVRCTAVWHILLSYDDNIISYAAMMCMS